jgi:N-methylhydantoinase B/oxoprolinase/acetone carboxylase alpha subunit
MTTPRTSPSSFDPITLEVIRHRLDTVAEEMETVLLKSSCSPIVKEGLDASASLFTLDGSTLAQACAIPIHLGTLIPAVAAIIAEFPVATMRKGDVYIMNDPYCGGTHLPDFAVVMPVFSSGQPVALAATMTHHQDVGGKTAGSVPTDSTEIYQEGLRIPPVQWAREGVFDQTLTKVLRLNVRIPDIFLGDLHAQIAACKIAAVRLDEMTARHGHNELLAAFGLLLDQSEALTRDALARLPKGTYRFVDWLDNDGIDIDRRIRIEVAATIAGGEIHFDLTGTDAQVRGPVNCVPSGSLAAACFAVRAVTDPTIPNNAGCFRPIRLTLPEGSLVNPTEPAPVNARTATIKRITGCMVGALSQAAPDRVPAANTGELVVMAFGGQWNGQQPFVTGDLLAGGSGASADLDGVDAIESDATNCMNVPAEAMEMEAPIRVNRCALRPDTGGAGVGRGGLGLVKEFEILPSATGGVSFSHRGERHFVAPPGVAGGYDGGLAASQVIRADGRIEEIPSKLVARLAQGDRVVVGTAGGAGWGDPLQRDRASARADLADGKIGAQAASAVYGLTTDEG